MFAGKSLGVKYRSDGYVPKKPVMIIPGLCSSCLKVVESPYEPWRGKRIWLSMSSIGFDKMWDMVLIGRKKKNNIVQEVGEFDEGEKRRWLAHMCLADDGVSDPEGIKLRAVKGLKGCKYLDPGAITDALSYVMGPLAEMLEDLGYVDGHNLDASPYDWRLPPCKLEERDGYFSELKKRIEKMYSDNGDQKIVIIAHSLGNRVTHYFTRFIEKKFGRQWTSKYIDNWLAIGPLWLGAPKLLRAMISGDRMGLEAFLYPPEGIKLARSLGSTAWMFPYISRADHDFQSYCKLNMNSKSTDKTNKDILIEGGAKQVYERYRDYYEGDPLYGNQDSVLAPPPIDNIYAIYGINLKTETFYFFKPSKSKKKVSDFVLDNSGSIPNYKCEGGIGYETKNTKQQVLGGEKRGGDGTVPYPSLSYCKKWKGAVNVKVAEIEGAEHREILKNKTFLQLVLEYVSQAPPPALLPVTFPDMEYQVKYDIKGKQAKRVLSLDKEYIRIKKPGGGIGEIRKYYGSVANIILDENTGQSFFIEYEDSNKAATFYTEQSAAIVQEIASRCRYIVEAKASYTEDRNEYGQTALHIAATNNDLPAAIDLLKGPIDINAVDLQGFTPLIAAAEKGNLDIMVVLLRQDNIDVNKLANNSKSVLHYMCSMRLQPNDVNQKKKWSSVISVLKNKSIDVNAVAEFGETALHQAVKRGNIEVVKWLLDNSSEVNLLNNVGETALHYAVRIGRKDIVELLLKSGADKNKESQAGESPISLANKTDAALANFIKGFSGAAPIRNSGKVAANVNKRPLSKDEGGKTPLHIAADSDRLDKVYDLLLQNANVNEIDKKKWTPLHYAANKGHIDVLAVLLNSYGVNVNAQTDNGSTILHYLMKYRPPTATLLSNYLRVLDQTKQKGAQLNLPSARGLYPLHEGCMSGNVEGCRWLISHQAKVNIPAKIGFTALHLAVQSKSLDLVKLLVEAKANLNAPSESGTPVEMAKNIDNAIYNYLLSVSSSGPRPGGPASPSFNQQRFQNKPPPQPTRRPNQTFTVQNTKEADDDDEIIYARDDDDDDEQVPGSKAVVPLAQRRRTIFTDPRATTYSVIFTKPPIGTRGKFSPGMNNAFPRQTNRANPGSGGGNMNRGGSPNLHNRGSPLSRGTSNPVVSRKFDKPAGGGGIPSPPPASALRKSDNVIHAPPHHHEKSNLSKSTNSISSNRGGRGQVAPIGNTPPRSQSPVVNRGSPTTVNRGSPIASPSVNRGSPAPVRGGSPSVRGKTHCAKCSTPRVPNMKFCGNCGTKLDL